MRTVNEALNIARSQIGTTEGPNNDTPYGRWYGANNNPWCAMFVSWVLAQNGMADIHFAYCPAGLNKFKDGTWGSIVDTPQPGDIGFLYFPSMHRVAHTFFVEEVRSDGRVVTIEGNTSTGGSREGTVVARHVRSTSGITFGRPHYDGQDMPRPVPQPGPVTPSAPAPTVPPYPGSAVNIGDRGPIVEQVQRRLAERGWTIRVDGKFGPVTKAIIQKFQRNHGLKDDGIVGPITWNALWTLPTN